MTASPDASPPWMDASAYLAGRVEDQITWYDKKSQFHQSWFKRLRLLEVLAAASIPVLSVAASDQRPEVILTIAGLGALVTIIAGTLGLYQFEHHWVEYRTTCESLKKEKFLFLTRSEPFHQDDAKNFQLLVQRVETLVSKENTNWAQYMMKPNDDPPGTTQRKG